MFGKSPIPKPPSLVLNIIDSFPFFLIRLMWLLPIPFFILATWHAFHAFRAGDRTRGSLIVLIVSFLVALLSLLVFGGMFFLSFHGS